MVDNNDAGDNSGGDDSSSNDSSQKNVQAEFYRKTEKLAEQQNALNQKLEQIASMLTQQQRPQQSSSNQSEEDLEALAYKDPKAYARVVREAAAAEAGRIVDARMNQQSQANSVLAQLGNEYPELADSTSDLTKRAVDIYKSLSPSEQATASAYKVAVRDAAAELGILPKAKRKSGGDDFTMGSSSSSQGASRSGNQRKSEDVDVRTLAFAEAVGLNIKDKGVVDRLKQRATRKNWGKYE